MAMLVFGFCQMRLNDVGQDANGFLKHFVVFPVRLDVVGGLIDDADGILRGDFGRDESDVVLHVGFLVRTKRP